MTNTDRPLHANPVVAKLIAISNQVASALQAEEFTARVWVSDDGRVRVYVSHGRTQCGYVGWKQGVLTSFTTTQTARIEYIIRGALIAPAIETALRTVST